MSVDNNQSVALLQHLSVLHGESDCAQYAIRLEKMVLQALGGMTLCYLLHEPNGLDILSSRQENRQLLSDMVDTLHEHAVISISIAARLKLIQEMCVEMRGLSIPISPPSDETMRGSQSGGQLSTLRNELDVIATPVLAELSLTTSRLIQMIELENGSERSAERRRC